MSLQNSHQISDVKVMLVKGADGKGIASIEKTGTSGLVDTYTITYDDGAKTTFTVTNGNGITSIEKTATHGLVDTYTIYFDNGDTETYEVTNGQGGGMSARLLINSDAGSTVTVTTPSGTVLTAQQVTGSTTQWYCDTTEYGVHTVDAILNGDDAQVLVSVDNCKIYTIDDSHFYANITVTYPADGTCSCSKSGTTTLYATGSPYTFTVHESGTYTITVEKNGVTKTENVTITTNGQTESVDMASITLTVDVYSASNDTISYTDANGSTQTITTNSSGIASNVTIIVSPYGATTFTSSVAKDPDNLSNDYSKAISFDGDETEIWIMPVEDCLYWYGYQNADLEIINSANGWDVGGGYTYTNPTFNTNYIDNNVASIDSTVCGVGSKTAIASGTKVCAIAQDIKGSDGWVNAHTSKSLPNPKIWNITSSSISKVEFDVTSLSNFYVYCGTESTRRTYTFALWVE